MQSLIRIKKKKNRIQSVKKTDCQSTRKNVVELGSVLNSCGFVDHATRASAATSAERMTAPEEKPAAPEAVAAVAAATVVPLFVAMASAWVVHPAALRLAMWKFTEASQVISTAL